MIGIRKPKVNRILNARTEGVRLGFTSMLVILTPFTISAHQLCHRYPLIT